MAEYKEKQISGRTWVRPSRVIIELPISGSPPAATFMEELAQVVGTETTTRALGAFSGTITPSNEDTEFNILDADGTVLGTMKYKRFLRALVSIYFDMAARRDAGTLVTVTPRP